MRKPYQIWLPILLVCLAAVTASAQQYQGGGSFMVQCPRTTPFHPTTTYGGNLFNPNPATPLTELNEPAYTGPSYFQQTLGGVPLTYVMHGGTVKCQQISGGDGMMTEADGNQTYMFSFGPLSGLENIRSGQPGTLFADDFNGGQIVQQIVITNGGTGYTSIPTVTISAPGGGGIQATGTANVNFVSVDGGPTNLVTSVTITNSGIGYTSQPTVTIMGGGGTGATAMAILGNGYYNSPTLPSECSPSAPTSCPTAGAAGESGQTYNGQPVTDPAFNPVKPLNINAAIADSADIMNIGVINGNIPMPMAAFDEDDEFFLTLSNVGMIMRPDLFEQHTVHFHGYPNASSFYDGVPDATWAINIGGSATYYYLAPDAGTYFYHCHITPPEHLQMGMVGQLYVRPRENRIPAGTTLYSIVSGNVQMQANGTVSGVGMQSDLRTACPGTGPTPIATPAQPNGAPAGASPDILCSAPVPQSNSFAQQTFAAFHSSDPFGGNDPRIPAGSNLKYVYNDGDGSTWYDIDVPVQIHGFDPNFHFVGMTFNPEGFADMKDKYFLLNGRSYPDTVNVPGYVGGALPPPVPGSCTVGNAHTYVSNPDECTGAQGTEDTDGRTRYSQPLSSLITLYQGERAALRLSDLDVAEYQTLASLGIPMQVVGFQAKLLRDEAGNNLPIPTSSVDIGGGESEDIILDSCLVREGLSANYKCDTYVPKGTYFLYTTNLDHLSNDAENFGGLMTEIVVQ